MNSSSYLFENFSFSKKYRTELIEFLKHNANVEHGGYRLFNGKYDHLLQIPEELADFIIYLKKQEKTRGKFQNLLEIGFGNGSTNSILNKFFNFKQIVVVDNFSAYTSNDTLVSNLKHRNMVIICGDSTSKFCINNAKNFGPFDLVFIDGNHKEPFVGKDYENFGSLVKKMELLPCMILHHWSGLMFLKGGQNLNILRILFQKNLFVKITKLNLELGFLNKSELF